MKNLKAYLLLAVVVLSFASCTEEKKEYIDLMPPEMSVISPGGNASVLLGDSIVLKCQFVDNDFLASYGISIKGTEGQTWSFSKTENFGTNEYDKIIELTIDAPEEDANAGAYNLIFWANDLQGNVDSVITNFKLVASAPPALNDNFDTEIDYLTDDLSKTIWDGFLLNAGTESEQNAEVLQANSITNPGTITIETINTGWEGGHDDGFFLYKNVPGGTNFEVSVQIRGGDFKSFDGAVVDYLTSGLMIKLAGSSDYTCANVFDRAEWSAVVGIRDVYKGDQNDKYDPKNKTGAKDTPWLKLVKLGKKVTAYNSADGITWSEMGSAEHDEYETANLQVGISHATFSANAGIAIFDNFTILYY